MIENKPILNFKPPNGRNRKVTIIDLEKGIDESSMYLFDSMAYSNIQLLLSLYNDNKDLNIIWKIKIDIHQKVYYTTKRNNRETWIGSASPLDIKWFENLFLIREYNFKYMKNGEVNK